MGRIKRVDQTKRIKIHDTGYRAPDTVFASNYEIRRGSRRRDLYRYEIWKELIYLIYFFFVLRMYCGNLFCLSSHCEKLLKKG